MKAFLIAVLFFAAFATYVNSQGAPNAGDGDAPGANAPAAGNPKGVDVQAEIDIEGIKCLCNLQASANTNGSVEASASGGGDCGLGDPAPTLSIDCSTVLNGKVDGTFFYILEVEKNGIIGHRGSWITLDQDKRWEATAINFPKGLSSDNDLTIITGGLSIDGQWQNKIFDLEKQNTNKLSLCNNDQTPGSWEYNLVEMSNQIVLDGRGCPLEEGAKTSVTSQPPLTLPPAIYQFPAMLPCDELSWDIKMTDPDKKQAFQIWYDFTPKGLCKPSAPKT